MRILIIGNIGTGKTTLGKTICNISENFGEDCRHSIDNLRTDFSDGTYAGEFYAWSKMLEYLQFPIKENEIFEFSGTGKNCWFVNEILKQNAEKYKTKWLVVYCSCAQEVLLDRTKNRVYDIPMPYKFGTNEETIKRMGADLKTKFRISYWDAETMAVQTDKFPPVICAKQILDKLGEPYAIN